MAIAAGKATPSRILVVEDEADIAALVAYHLTREGYRVRTAASGAEALAAIAHERPDLVVLDVMLPGRDGFEVCRTLRTESNVPILMLSARGEEIDRVIGLEIGADDYLAKPFAMRELRARVRAMLRRARMADDTPRGADGPDPGRTPDGLSVVADELVVGDIVISASRHEATARGAPLALTSKEFALLHYLARHPGIVLSRDALLREVWGYDFPVDTRTVDVHISWLRQKIEEDPARPRRILTVRGHGYRLVPVERPSEGRTEEPGHSV